MAGRAAQDIADGAYVNLGIGFPEMVARFQLPGRQAIFHAENGIWRRASPGGRGLGPDQCRQEGCDAGARHGVLSPCRIFAMVRGGQLDVAILDAYEVAETGDLANWSTGPKGVPAVGGATVHDAKMVAVITDHVTRDGQPKLVQRCALPLTGVGCVTRIYSSLAVIDVVAGRFVLRATDGLVAEGIAGHDGARLHRELRSPT